jgi:hypothetical protein
MADDELERRVAQRYGELRKEAPPPELDARILAAARGATRRRPRWSVPLAAAAVLVLAVAVTYQVQKERPSEEFTVPASAPPAAPRPVAPEAKPAVPSQERRERFTPSPASAPPAADMASEAARAPVPEERPAPPSAVREEARVGGAAAQAPSAAPLSRAARSPSPELEQSPELWLERILELRRAGRHEQADEELAAFRKRYPERGIPPAALRP